MLNRIAVISLLLWPVTGASALAQAPKAGNFYCFEKAINTTSGRIPTKFDSLTLSNYAIYFHNGTFGYSVASDSYTVKGVKLSKVGNTAVLVGPKKQKWTITPIGGRNAVVKGPGLYEGVADGLDCAWS